MSALTDVCVDYTVSQRMHGKKQHLPHVCTAHEFSLVNTTTEAERKLLVTTVVHLAITQERVRLHSAV